MQEMLHFGHFEKKIFDVENVIYKLIINSYPELSR